MMKCIYCMPCSGVFIFFISVHILLADQRTFFLLLNRLLPLYVNASLILSVRFELQTFYFSIPLFYARSSAALLRYTNTLYASFQYDVLSKVYLCCIDACIWKYYNLPDLLKCNEMKWNDGTKSIWWFTPSFYFCTTHT